MPITRKSQIQLVSQTHDLSQSADLPAAFAALPPVLAQGVTFSLAGSRSQPVTYSLSEPAVLARHVLAAHPVCLKADASAYSGTLSLSGGGADWITIAKGSLGWQAGDWAGARLGVLSCGGDAGLSGLSGEGRTISVGGALSASADGSVPGDGSCWKLTVDSAFSTSIAAASSPANVVVALFACIIERSGTALHLSGNTALTIENLFINGQVVVSNGALLKASRSALAGFGGYNALAVFGGSVESIADQDPLHLIGNANTALLVSRSGYVKLNSGSSAHKGYISGTLSGNAIQTGSGVDIGGNLEIGHYVFDNNTWYALALNSGWASVRDCMGFGAGDQTKLLVTNNSACYTHNNSGLQESIARDGIFE